jgi:hypothetical protein
MLVQIKDNPPNILNVGVNLLVFLKIIVFEGEIFFKSSNNDSSAKSYFKNSFRFSILVAENKFK